MNPHIFRQYDTRWGSLPYPGRPYTVARSGCGLCAVTHCVIEIPKYKDYTPKNIRPFMVKYATRGQGTLWKGIRAALEHYGYTVAEPNINKSMKPAWELLNRKDALKVGVLLFGSSLGGSQRVRWTSGGHYVQFCNYRYDAKTKRHWFYTKDSGSRKHDGWKWGCYELHMKGDVRHIFICTSLKDDGKTEPKKEYKKPTGKYSGSIPNPTMKLGSGGARVKLLQKFLNWYFGAKLAVDGEYGEKTEDKVKLFQKTEGITADGIFGTKSYEKAIAYAEKSDTIKKARTMVDVSYWQHDIDWKKASKHIDGAILRATYTGQKSFVLSDDSTFAKNVKNATANGVPVGAYHYSQAITVAEAKKEAEYICRKLNSYKKKITLPVVIDWEFGGRLNASKAKSLGKAKCTEIVSAFCNTVIDYGYTAMVYANYSTFSNYLDYDKLRRRYLIWLAQYSKKASLNYDYWQYTSSGHVDGISGKVDMNKVVSK